MDILLNWLWQGWALTMMAWATLKLCRRLSATTRHQVWWTTLILLLVLPAFPLLSVLIPSPDLASSENSSTFAVALPPLPRWPLQTFFVGWALWIAVMLCRGISSFRRMRELKRACTAFPPQREARLGQWMSVRTTGRHVRLVVSDDVRCAAAVGFRSPVIAVAPVVLRELDDAELDRILVHEWAHIQRRDDIARLAQMFVTTLVGFNPAVWWIGRRLDLEREVACDDLVIEMTGNRTAYAKSLMKLAGMPGRPLDLALVSAALATPALTTRIVRLLDHRRNVSTRRFTIARALAASGLFVQAITLAATQTVTFTEAALVQSVDEAFSQPLTTSGNSGIAEAYQVRHVSLPLRDSDVSGNQGLAQEQTFPSQSTESTSAASRPGQQRSRPSATDEPIVINNHPLPLAGQSVTADFGAAPPALLTQHPAPFAPSTGATGATEAVETPWGAAANAGTALGRASKERATRASGFFTKLGKKIGESF